MTEKELKAYLEEKRFEKLSDTVFEETIDSLKVTVTFLSPKTVNLCCTFLAISIVSLNFKVADFNRSNGIGVLILHQD